jgi:CRISP-associated protein Cas1
MRKLLNTLYVTSENSYLSKDGLNVVISDEGGEKFRIPVVNIESIVTFGYMGVSPGLMKLCYENNVSITFLSPNGRFISRIQGPTKGNVLLRKLQYSLSADADFSLKISRIIVAGKIYNYRSILRRFIRDNGENDIIGHVANYLEQSQRLALQAISPDQLLGIEGDAANSYFNVFPILILRQKDDFIFKGRNRRPPKDEVNAMLSFIYTLIANDVSSALETIGLDPYVGFYHKLRPGRTSLALDLMEELRAYLGDRCVLSMINTIQIKKGDFISQGEDGITMSESGRKALISYWQNRKKETVIHPFLNESIPIGLIPYVQAMLFARFLRGDIDDYPIFLIK